MTFRDTPSTSPGTPPTITARSPDDLLASVPVLLGFTPSESVVMLTFGATASFHARIDLPRSAVERDAVIETLLEPTLSHGVTRVAFVVYAAEPAGVLALSQGLCAAFVDHGIDVFEALHANGTEWFPALSGSGERGEGVPYDDRTHPISLRALVDGHVSFASREALAASLRGKPSLVSAVANYLAPATRLGERQVAAEAAWVLDCVRRHAKTQTQPDDADTARLLGAMHDLRIRDVAWCALTRETAKDLVDFWTGIVRRSPESVLAAPATMLAFAAWLSGHGAMAWCALDRCRESDPTYALAALMARMLDRAVPPSAWVPPTELITQLGV